MKRPSITEIRNSIETAIDVTRREIIFLRVSEENEKVKTIIACLQAREKTLGATLNALNGDLTELQEIQYR